MQKKPYKLTDEKPVTANEPAVAYQPAKPATEWNPNAPVHATQEEWWEYIHRIEEGPFYTLEEFDEKFEIWKKAFLAGRQ
ncbi:hypothetical protein FACS189438_0410 [Bacteroidia bacterium]|nr:hypothetical protein FACS189438_0410 [Bacteroidia bacterium]